MPCEILRTFLVLAWGLLLSSSIGSAQVAEKLVTLQGSETGSYPSGKLLLASDGNFYGTTELGGNGGGTVFRIDADGVLENRFSFAATGQPRLPIGSMIELPDGNLLGFTSNNSSPTIGGTAHTGVAGVFVLPKTGSADATFPSTRIQSPYSGNGPVFDAAGFVVGPSGYRESTGTSAAISLFNSSGAFQFGISYGNVGGTSFDGGSLSGLTVGQDGRLYGINVSSKKVYAFNPSAFSSFDALGESNIIASMPPDASFGQFPLPLAQHTNGDLYGVSSDGFGFAPDYAASGFIFKVTLAGSYSVLVNFTGPNGRTPKAGLTLGSDGNFYGTTSAGGANGFGTVFKLTPDGTLTTLVHFAGTNGSAPVGGLIEGGDGAFYGTTSADSITGRGTIFRVTTDGVLTTMHVFGRTPLSTATGALAPGETGAMLGTTRAGGVNGLGSIYRLGAGGSATTLAEFTGAEGSAPNRGLVRVGDGSIYGTARTGGVNGMGTIFKLSPAGVLSAVVSFTGANGATPAERLALLADGSLLGTTESGGANGLGTVFKLSPAGVLTTLGSFAGADGSGPFGGLVLAGDGAYYGTTRAGGANGFGTIFRVTTADVVETVASLASAPPAAGLALGLDGKLYGTTRPAQEGYFSEVYRVSLDGMIEQVVNLNVIFNGKATSALLRDASGAFYGVTEHASSFPGPTQSGNQIFKVTPDGTLTVVQKFSTTEKPVGELAFGGDGNLYGATSEQVYRFIFPGPALVESGEAALVTATTAQLSGKLNARGSLTSARFEYGTDGLNFPFSKTAAAAPFVGYATTTAYASLTGLVAGTTYYFRIVATSNAGTSTSAVQTFTTLSPPTVAATGATTVGPTSATLAGFVNGRGRGTSVVIEFGTDGINFPNTVVPTPASVTGATNVFVSAAVSGLAKGTRYFYRIVASNDVGTTAGAPASFTTLIEPLATIGGAFALTTTSVRVSGSVDARGSDAQVFFDYGTDGVNFPNSVSALPTMVTGSGAASVIGVLPNLAQNVTYHYRLRAESAGGTGLSTAATASVAVLSGFTQVAPGAPLEANGFIVVNLSPTGITAGWRFVGEQQWRPPGVPAGGLVTADREIEFRPVPGYLQPLRETVSIISGAVATVVDREYFPTESNGTGELSVTLKPESLTLGALAVAQRAQWRLLGEDDNAWRESEATVSGLAAGVYLVECKPLAGRTTPPVLSLAVQAGATSTAVATYFLADGTVGAFPSVLPFETVTAADSPYAFVGQIRSDAGAATGFVVKPRVVATAGHVVFDDGRLTYATGLQWLFQRDRGSYEPKPQTPHGSYVFAGYAAQRAADNSPGESTPASQQLDAAAIYFLEDAGRGGYCGFLASDATDNEFLTSPALKTLVGYPVDGVAPASQGRVHATTPTNITFTRVPGTTTAGAPYRLFGTNMIRSSGGNSGGPLCVQFEGGAYYPAGIYLGGTGQTVVRAIDSAVIDLFSRAEISANSGGNNSGNAGIPQVITPGSISTLSGGSVRVNLDLGSGGWRIGSGDFLAGGATRNNLAPGTYTVTFKAVSGYATPAAKQATVTSGQLTITSGSYNGISTQPLGQTVTAGSNVTFAVGVTGTPSSYQWQRNSADIPGANSASYSISGATTAHEGLYRVKVTWNGVTVTSEPAALGVISQEQSYSTLASRGFVLPGAGVDARIPSTAIWTTFGVPSINDQAQVAVLGNWSNGATTGAGIFAGNPLALVAARGEAAPGAGGAVFSIFNDPALDHSGAVAFRATLVKPSSTSPLVIGAANNSGIWTNVGGSLVLAARTGDSAPDCGGAVFKNLSAFTLVENEMLITASLGGTGVTTASDMGVWRWTPADGLRLLLREGQYVPVSGGTKVVSVFQMLGTVAGTPGHGRHHLAAGIYEVRVTCTDKTVINFVIDATGAAPQFLPLAQTGQALVGGLVASVVGVPAGNALGESAFTETFKVAKGGATSANNLGVLAGRGGAWELVARKGSTVQGKAKWATFADPVLNGDGAVAWTGTLSGATTATNTALAWSPLGSAVQIVARNGSVAPGTGGGQFATFTSMALPDGAGPLFTATLVNKTGTVPGGPGGVTTANDTGLWSADATGTVHLLLRESQMLLGRTVKGFNVLANVTASPGQTRCFNAQRKVIAMVTFSDGTQSLVAISAP